MCLIKLVLEEKKKIRPGIRQVRPPQHDVWGALECTAAPVSVHKDIHLDFEEVVTTYGHKHPRRMLLGRPLDAWFSSCWTSFVFHRHSRWLYSHNLFYNLFFLSSWSSQWLQIVCKSCKYMYKLPCNSLSDFSEIIPQNSENAYLRIPIFKISRGSMPPDPPRVGEGRPSPWSRSDHKFWGLSLIPPPPPRDSNPGSATVLCFSSSARLVWVKFRKTKQKKNWRVLFRA